MISAMSLKGFFRNDILQGSQRKKSRPWQRCSLNRDSKDKHLQNAVSTLGTLPRGQKQIPFQGTCSLSNSLVDYTDPERTLVLLEKQDNETFGFEIQTYGLLQKNGSAVEMCTFVCNVQEHSPAENAGLAIGDIIVTVNGSSTEGSAHQHILELIQNSTNLLAMETINGTMVKIIQLENKLRMLKKSLREKWVELRAVTLQEQRLIRGNLNDALPFPSLDMSVSFSLPMSERCSSDGSCGSIMAVESEEGAPLPYISEDLSPSNSSHTSATGEDCFSSSDFTPRGLLYPRGHTCSVSLAGSTGSPSLSPSPSRDVNRASSPFETLPWKSRQTSVRKRIMKLILGNNCSLKKEESH
ncbi:cytohesin-interacting protein-like isoform X1 [Anguilla rostrata]|uniref:cytohesin-interacting protein-like isoform X1 n=1 Tax=Anguilla rostrata TaxID=7938 RepID=UPI0030CFFD57